VDPSRVTKAALLARPRARERQARNERELEDSRTAEITDYVRPFHDARHASLTNGAAGGEKAIALMARAGHRNMATTNQYVHLAGVVFRDEANALEQRLLGTERADAKAVERPAGLR
jgi:integrase